MRLKALVVAVCVMLTAAGALHGQEEPKPRQPLRVIQNLQVGLADLEQHPVWAGRCLVVWLFDESRSMTPVQKIIAGRVARFLAPAHQRMRILTVVSSFGRKFHVILGKPSRNGVSIQNAVGKIPVDVSGKENVLTAVNEVLNRFGPDARKFARKIVIILVTDEAGDDVRVTEGKPDPLEATLARMKNIDARLVVFGHEAGTFSHSVEKTFDPTVPKGVSPWAFVNRGIETAFGETFPHDWYFRRTERVPSGFGPYALSRLCRETGGVYYLVRAAKAPDYDYEKLLSGYEPELASRAEIAKRNTRNDARRLIMQLVMDAKVDRDKGFRTHFADTEGGRVRMMTCRDHVDHLLAVVEKGIAQMKQIGPAAFRHSPKRWQANRELMWAELHKLRFQLGQFRRTLHDLMTGRRVMPPGELGWRITHVGGELRGQAEVLLAEKRAIEAMYRKVIEKHAGTPWAVFAESEMKQLDGYAIRPWSRRASPRLGGCPTAP